MALRGLLWPVQLSSLGLPCISLFFLIISPFFLYGVLFKSRSRSVMVVTPKGNVSTALGAH